MAARITIIDDSAEVAEVVAEVLELAGYVVTRFGEPVPASLVGDTDPDLIVLDLWFPNKPLPFGWHYLKQLRAHGALRAVPVLICSADVPAIRARKQEVDADPRLGALTKPFRIDQLEAAVSELVDLVKAPHWDDAMDLVLVADASSRLVDASPMALMTLGLSLADLRDRTVADIVAADPQWTATEWARYRESRAWEGPVVLRQADGQQLPANARAEILGREPSEWHVSVLTL